MLKKYCLRGPLVSALLGLCLFSKMSAAVINVSAYGATADDGNDDTAAINNAIAAAAPGDTVAFAAGTYDLITPYDANQLIRITGKTNVTLQGATVSGAPATTLLRHITTAVLPGAAAPFNQADPARTIYGVGNTGLVLRNFVINNTPQLTTAGQITEIDAAGTYVKVKIFSGLPMASGSACYSANVWNHTTHNLKHVPSLTSGIGATGSPANWTIDDAPNRIMKLYKSTGLPFLSDLAVGEDMSWHYGSDGRGQMEFGKNDGLTLENLVIRNTINMAILIGSSNNVTVTGITMRPDGNQLAVGPRDGIHLSRCTGAIICDGLDITGVRLDGFVVRTPYAEITAVTNSTSFRIESELATFGQVIAPGSGISLISPTGGLYNRVVSPATYDSSTGRYDLVIQTALPSFATTGTPLKVGGLGPDSVSLTNSSFTNIGGSAMILFADDITVDNVTSRHVMYPAIHMGSNVTAGVCGNNITVKNSLFDSCGWVAKSGHRGMITLANDHGTYTEALLTNVTIQDNIFANQFNGTDASIDVSDTDTIHVTGNYFENVQRGLKINTATVTGYTVTGNEVVINNDSNGTSYSEISGSFADSSLVGYAGYNGTKTRYASGAAKAQWTFVAPKSGAYQVSIYKVQASSSDTNAKISVSHDSGTAVSYVDYTTGTSGWVSLGTYNFTGGGTYTVTNERSNGYLRADAVRFVQP